MIILKSSAAKRPLFFVSVGLVLWALSFAGTAHAQVIPAGTTIDVRTTQGIDTRDSNGRVFHGVVEHDVFGRNGNLVIPRGSDAELIVRRISGNEVALDLDSVDVRGERYGVESTSAAVGTNRDEGIGANKRTGKYLGGGAIIGAIIGGIAGGGKGAAIGAGAGAAVGAGAQVLTRGGRIAVPAESLLTFQLTESLRAGVYDQGYVRNGAHYHQGYGNSAYEDGLRDGREDATRNSPQNAIVDRRTGRDRMDYQAGYNDGYQNRYGYESGREKPGRYSGSPWTISIAPNNFVTWQAPDNARVYVQADNGARNLFASGQSGTQAAPWMQRGHVYIFILQDQNGNEVARTEKDLR